MLCACLFYCFDPKARWKCSCFSVVAGNRAAFRETFPKPLGLQTYPVQAHDLELSQDVILGRALLDVLHTHFPKLLGGVEVRPVAHTLVLVSERGSWCQRGGGGRSGA